MGHLDSDVSQTFDAGGSYMSVPWWVPFGRTLSRLVGISVGQWLGGMLGYAPFYGKWTNRLGKGIRESEDIIFSEKIRSSCEDRVVLEGKVPD